MGIFTKFRVKLDICWRAHSVQQFSQKWTFSKNMHQYLIRKLNEHSTKRTNIKTKKKYQNMPLKSENWKKTWNLLNFIRKKNNENCQFDTQAQILSYKCSVFILSRKVRSYIRLYLYIKPHVFIFLIQNVDHFNFE